jgi:hypothetical protein
MQKARQKYPSGMVGIMRLNETGTCGKIWFQASLVRLVNWSLKLI